MEQCAVIKIEDTITIQDEEERTMLDTGKFILLVQSRPELYDWNLREHHYQDVIKQAWLEISKELNVPASVCKVKWHALRTSYNRYLREVSRIPPNSKIKRRKWHLADSMSFLRPFVPRQKERPNKLTPLPSRTTDAERADDDVDLDIDHDDSYATDSGENSTTGDNAQTADSASRKRKSSAENIIAYLQSEEAKRKKVDDDPMMCFFKGILPDVNRLSGRRLRNFRNDVLQSLSFYLDEQEDDTITSTYSVDLPPLTNQSEFEEVDFQLDQRSPVT